MPSDLDAIKRIVDQYLPVEMDFGTVVAVDSTSVLIALRGGSPQPCGYDPASNLGAGDYVMLVRPAGSQQSWAVASVLGRTRQGVSNQARVDNNRVPGGVRFARTQVQYPSGWVDIDSGSYLVLLTTFFEIMGGTLRITYNGYLQYGTTSSEVTLAISVDGNIVNVWRGKTISVPETYAVSFSHLRANLNGRVKIELLGLATSGGTPILNHLEFSLEEV